MKAKKAKCLFLSFLLLLSFLFALSSYADKGLQGKGKGDAIQPGDSGEWENYKSGYRFTIVDKDLNTIKIIRSYSIKITNKKTDYMMHAKTRLHIQELSQNRSVYFSSILHRMNLKLNLFYFFKFYIYRLYFIISS